MVQVDAHLAVAGALVAEGVLDLRNRAVLGVGEEVLAHGLRGRAVDHDLVDLELNLRPAIALVRLGLGLGLG